MKTAAIVYEFPSVSETFVLSQISGLIDAGCDVRIYADSANRVALAHGESGQDALVDRVTYFGLPFKQLRESVGDLRSRFPARGAALDPVEHPSRRFSEAGKAGLRLRFEARAFGRQSHFDVIHAHFGPNGVRAVRLRDMGAIAGPVLTSFYGYDVGRHWTRGGYARLFRMGERFIALSDHMRERLVMIGCPAARIIVHRLGVDLDRFSAAPQSADSPLEIISIARLVAKKGIEHGLRAVLELSKKKIRIRYTIVGHGPLRGRLERLARGLGIDAIVRFAGAQPQAKIPGMLARSHVLLAPSVTAMDGDTEGTPVAILEAHASGLPVVSTLHAGIPEIVDDGRSGYLVPEGSVGELADRLAHLSESPSLRESMGQAGRAIVTAKHDSRVLNEELLEIYRSLAG